jgi:hypothetical protein
LDIKNSIEEVKKELTTDEQMLVSAFKLEKLYKKHKIKIFIVVGALVVFFGGRAIMDMIENNRLNSANEAYLALEKNPNDTKALETLKSKNPKLYELYTYKKAVKNRDTKALSTLSSSKNEFVSDMSHYHLSLFEKKPMESQIYRDFALIDSAVFYIRDGKINEAKNQLSVVDEKSPVYNISKLINHYTIKGK